MFDSMNLRKEILTALHEMKFEEPTEVQKQAIPLELEGKDVVVKSKTGSGKTAAFVIPILNSLEKNEKQAAMIITPTRELALQVTEVVRDLGRHMQLRAVTIYGGASINYQIREIKNGANIIIGTPGRLIDLMKRRELNTDFIRFLVLDEVDIMLDMGFIDDIKYILSKLPKKRQTMFFSATIPEEIKHITLNYTNNPVNVNIDGGEVTVSTIQHFYSIASGSDKFATLLAYLEEKKPDKAIIFCKTQRNAERIHSIMQSMGMQAVLMHGGLSQNRREHSLNMFKEGVNMLIATNVAARGLDIDNVSDIINFDAETDPKAYVHRVGRSARMGKSGRAFTIFTHGEKYLVYEIENYAKVKLSPLEFDLAVYRTKMNEFYKENGKHEFETALRRSNFNSNRNFRGNNPHRREFGRSNSNGSHYSRFKRDKFKHNYSKEDQ
jgi:superfamily II DNA/RNA helicase